MSFIVYDANKKGSGRGGKADLDAIKFYCEHFANSLALMHIARVSRCFFKRQTANNELRIAERKMAFWQNHANFNLTDALRVVAVIKSRKTELFALYDCT